MNINLTYLIISLICNLLIFSDAVLASRQQDQTWLQQSSEHFTVIYPSHVSRTAKQILAIAEDNFAGVAATAGYQPKGLIPLVLNHDTDYANAFAQSVFKKIEINLTPSDSPEFGGDNISWWEDLFLHEYVHLCHGMNDEQGISWLLSTLFGEVNGLNFIAPRWWVEGIGVYSESSQTDGGRGESSYFQMQLAGNLLSDQPWTRAQVSHSPKFSRPWGRIYYLGYDLIKQASLTEPQIIKKVSREQSNWPFWGLGAVWRHVLNQSLDKHWQATLNLKTREFKERYQNKGTPIKGGYYLTNVKDNDYQSPQWIDHQRLIVLEDNIDFGKNIVEININSKQKKYGKLISS